MDKFPDKDRIEVVLKSDRNEVNPDIDEISLRQIIQALIDGKKIIAVTVILALVFSMIGLYIITPYSGVAKIMISLNFEGIEKGLDPHGKKFDLGKIKAPVVTSKVIEDLDLERYGISADDLRRNIGITPVVPGQIVEKIKNLKESVEKGKENVKSLEEFVYYPTDYIITLNIPKNSKISKSKAQEILNGIVDAYAEYFYETYGDRAVLANAVGSFNYSDYDYPEVSIVMHNQIDIMKNYLEAKNREASDFRSQKTGLAFVDILESINVIDSVDINKMDSIIGSFKLTKDKDKLLKSLEYAIKRNELNKAKKEDEAKIASDLMNKFQKDKNLILMPGNTTTPFTTFETDNPNPFYDSLAERSLNSGVMATNNAHEIEYYKKEIEYFSGTDTIPSELKKKAEEDVLKLMDSIKNKLEHWIKLTNETVSEYYETKYYQKAIQKLSPAEITSANSNAKLILAVSLVLGLMVGIFAALFAAYWKNSGAELMSKAKELQRIISNKEGHKA